MRYRHGILRILQAIFLMSLFAGCSLTKTIEPGDYLYTGSSLEVEAPDSVSTKALESELEGLLAPSTNRKIFGLPYRLIAYNLFASEKEKGLGPWLQRTLGEEPILFDPDFIPRIEQVLTNRSFNNGYFWNTVQVEVDSADRKAHVNYRVRVDAPYTLGAYALDIRDSTISQLLTEAKEETELEVGAHYDLGDLKTERQRLEEYLRREGYYYFNQDQLLFYGDTTFTDRKVNLTLMLKEEIPDEALRPAYISSIHIYPSYQETGVDPEGRLGPDSVFFHGQDFEVRAKPILRAIIPRPGDRYHLDYHERTQQRLLSLPFYQFANIRFRSENGADSLLRMDIFLSPGDQHTISGSVGLAHKSTHFFGPELNLTYLNRNFFGGSELLRLSADANFNFPLRRSVGQYYEEIELSSRLTRPGLLVPFLNQRARRRVMRPGTNFEFTFKRQRATVPLVPTDSSAAEYSAILREFGFPLLADNIDEDSTYAPFVAINEPEFRFGYQWMVNETVTHFFNPIRLRLQYTSFEEEELETFLVIVADLSGDLGLLLSLQRMFIYQPEYILVYDQRLDGVERHNLFYRGRLAFAGNSLIDPLFKEIDEAELESQYLQTEHDFRYFLNFPGDHVLAYRFVTNFSYPLGNALILPIFDFYSVGGPNSIRAFGTRQVGPGTRPPDQAGVSDLLRGKGDIKIETSLEYRRHLTSMFELGMFFDAGNVWFYSDRAAPESDEGNEVEFEFKDFYRELAVGTGVGLRVLLSGLVIRLDFGVPLRKPWFPEGERWLPDGIKLGDPSWRKENIVWSLAFGYSF